MKLVCDTNVLVSGLLFGGHCRAILRLVSEGRADGFTSGALLAELEGVLIRPKFGLGRRQVAAAVDLVRQTFVVVAPTERVHVVLDDPDDNAVLEAALAADADAIVSGDAHLLDVGAFRGIRILAPGSLVEEFQNPQD